MYSTDVLRVFAIIGYHGNSVTRQIGMYFKKLND